ncbi:MAG: homing endonuclease associated repeat-containing protein [Paracoccaceae bacterium]
MFQVKLQRKSVPDEELIEDLKDVASGHSKTSLTTREYNNIGRFHSTLFIQRFGSWLVALEKAGLSRTFHRNIPEDELFENFARVWVETGRQPSFHKLKVVNSKYSSATYVHRFGSWNKALLAFEAWANEGDGPPKYADSLPIATRRSPRAISWRLRAKVLMRDGATCQLCGASPQSGARLHVDHVVPWSKGGDTSLENLRILCAQCNIGKGDFMPESEHEI